MFEGDARAGERFGELIASACAAEEKEPALAGAGSTWSATASCGRRPWSPAVIARGPKSVAGRRSGSRRRPGRRRRRSNLCLAANAMGYATCWVTEWLAYSPRIAAALGLTANEKVAGSSTLARLTKSRPTANVLRWPIS